MNPGAVEYSGAGFRCTDVREVTHPRLRDVRQIIRNTDERDDFWATR